MRNVLVDDLARFGLVGKRGRASPRASARAHLRLVILRGSPRSPRLNRRPGSAEGPLLASDCWASVFPTHPWPFSPSRIACDTAPPGARSWRRLHRALDSSMEDSRKEDSRHACSLPNADDGDAPSVTQDAPDDTPSTARLLTSPPSATVPSPGLRRRAP
jgi:hypothetical protein